MVTKKQLEALRKARARKKQLEYLKKLRTRKKKINVNYYSGKKK